MCFLINFHHPPDLSTVLFGCQRATPITGEAKYKRDIEDEKIRLTDFDSEKSLIELYFDQREVAPIHYDTGLKVLAGLQTEAGCERIFRSMTAQVRAGRGLDHLALAPVGDHPLQDQHEVVQASRPPGQNFGARPLGPIIRAVLNPQLFC